MISTDTVHTLIGGTAYGPGGEKLGTIGQIYLDTDTGRPEWATVKTGLFGTRENFVPLAEAEQTEDGLRLPFDKDRIRNAPGIDADRDLSPEEESTLYDYYGTGGGTSTGYGSTTGYGTTGYGTTDYGTTGDVGGRDVGTGDAGYRDAGYQDAGYRDVADEDAGTGRFDDVQASDRDAMTRSEERVRTGTETVPTGRARLRKYVVTDTQQVTVPVSHEEVRLEREPVTDANRDAAFSGPDLTESEHEVVLNEERPVVQKETVPVERVRLAKEQVTGEETMDVDVRQERIDTDVDTDAEQRRR